MEAMDVPALIAKVSVAAPVVFEPTLVAVAVVSIGPVTVPGGAAATFSETDIGWHTFRHSYRSWLDETGAALKVQQELMRHASIQTTMNAYGRAMLQSKREANRKVVEMALRGAPVPREIAPAMVN
jgi:hypothetical protein